jgi:hypothetical protein
MLVALSYEKVLHYTRLFVLWWADLKEQSTEPSRLQRPLRHTTPS